MSNSGGHRNNRRVPMSLSAEQVQWLASVLAALLRGGDVRGVMRVRVAELTLKTIFKAKERAASIAPPKPNVLSLTCRHGHEFTADNTYVVPSSGTRRCRACLKTGHQRAWALKKVQAQEALLTQPEENAL